MSNGEKLVVTIDNPEELTGAGVAMVLQRVGAEINHRHGGYQVRPPFPMAWGVGDFRGSYALQRPSDNDDKRKLLQQAADLLDLAAEAFGEISEDVTTPEECATYDDRCTTAAQRAEDLRKMLRDL